ncbi:class I SAM-dependent methyltransferase [Paenibacillus alvei]|uniref:class I SAM-dependent methyltransferase n=1 Tax=Paenibacillus alvei TaxID=44250 RepID=UPI001E4B7EA2|nr:methyltransferase domain-containing protein [Paenibacillus alvei]
MVTFGNLSDQKGFWIWDAAQASCSICFSTARNKGNLSQEAIKIASDKSSLNQFHCGDINHYVPAKKYDVIVFNESLHYVPNTPQKLLDYSNYLTSNGVIISSLYSHKNKEDLAYTMIENKIVEMEQCKDFEVMDKVSVFNHHAELKWYVHLLKRKRTNS